MKESGQIRHVSDLLSIIERDTNNWQFSTRVARPWFRGQRNADNMPLPFVFRKNYEEVGLSLMFRERAAIYGDVPDRSGCIDEWLFLMQHFDAPTRLLDWTESALASLFFASYKKEKDQPDDNHDAAIWMLHPLELNKLKDSIGEEKFPNTWSDHSGNKVRENLARAFGLGTDATKYPIAVQTTFRKLVMGMQKSCFTIHGTTEYDFEKLFEGSCFEKTGFFRKYIIPSDSRQPIENELDALGISYSAIFPDFKGLGIEMKYRFRKDLIDQASCLHREHVSIKHS